MIKREKIQNFAKNGAKKNTTTSIKISGGLMFPLFLIFLVLKLTNVIDWSWWWVCSPLWLPTVFVLSLVGIFFLVMLIIIILVAIFDR